MRAFVMVFSSVALLSGVLHADPVINNTGISSPTRTITFDELTFPTGTAITTQFAGVTFSPNMFYNVQPLYFTTASLANYNFSTLNDPITILFDRVVTSAAVAVISNPGQTVFTALLDGVVVERFSAATNFSVVPDLTHSSNFYGFEGIEFNELRIEDAPLNLAFQIDNLQIGGAPGALPPDSGAMFLMLSGLGGTDGKIAYGWLGNVDPNSRFPGNGFDFANTFDFGGATVNANTTYSVAGHVNAPGFSPHIYSAIGGDVSPEVQLALVEGTLALQTQSFDMEAFEELAGFMDAGDVVLIDPLVLLAFYAQYLPFPPGSEEYDRALEELEFVLFGVQNPLVITDEGASAGGDDILFPHFPIEGITLNITFTLPQIDPDTGEFVGTTLEITSQVIPEPGSIALVVVGLVGALALRRRRRAA